MLLTARPLSQPSAALARVRGASGRFVRLAAAAVVALATLARPELRAQQTPPVAATNRVTLTGVVKDVATGAPIAGVTVRVPGMGSQATTDATGTYRIPDLPMGSSVSVEASRLGYGVNRAEGVKLDQSIVKQDMQLNSNVMTMEVVTTSGVADGISGIKTPFYLTRLDIGQIPMPRTTNAVLSLQGRVPGLRISQMSGLPLDSNAVLMRAAMSPFRGNQPLYVIDGVPINDIPFTSADIFGLDIESIEILRGAAAASYYGSRAANGVISITLKRSREVPVGVSALEFRQDIGMETLGQIPDARTAHPFLLDARGNWVNAAGDSVGKFERVMAAVPFQINPYSESYDPVRQALYGKRMLTSRMSIMQASPVTNLSVSFNRNVEPGLIRFNKGLAQNNIRFFLGHQLRSNLSFDASYQHARSTVRELQTSFQSLFELEPNVNLLGPSVDRERLPTFPYAIQPDTGSAFLNPIYTEWRSENYTRRQRNTLSTDMQFRPWSWIALRGTFGYDRADGGIERFLPPNVPDGPASVTPGTITYSKGVADGLYGDIAGTVIREFGSLTSSLTLKGHGERQNSLAYTMIGTQIGSGFVNLGNALQRRTDALYGKQTLTNGSGNLGLNYDNRYITDVVFMREGNSRFGNARQWSSSYRASGAWLFSEEAWYPASLSKLNLAKLRVSVGSANNQPTFVDQFDNIEINQSNGLFIRQNMANPDLRPEKKRDIEVGTDFIWNNRISLALTYTDQRLTDAITATLPPANTGFQSTFRNIGSTKGSTIEAALEGTWITKQIRNTNFRWRSDIVASRSKSHVVSAGDLCLGIGTFHPTCDGVGSGEVWGYSALRTLDDLDRFAPSFTPYRSWWDVNDEGLLVPVGEGNRWYEGTSKNLWGTPVTFVLNTPEGQRTKTLSWGLPQWGPWQDTTDGLTGRNWHKLGDTQPLLDFGIGNRFNYGSWMAYVHFRGALGGDVWNGFTHNQIGSMASPMVDQIGKADSLKKPIWYYSGPPAGTSDDPTQGLAVGRAVDNAVAFDTDVYHNVHWMKLGEAMLAYSIDSRDFQLLRRMGAQRVNLQVMGRDLYTFKGSYPGLDPEILVARGNGYLRYDDYRYPPTRHFSASATIIF